MPTQLPKTLLGEVATRKKGGSFGGGITTADRYVRNVIDTFGGGGEYVQDVDALLKRASETLTFCDPAGTIEHFDKQRIVTDPSDLLPKGKKITLPENTLMVLQHVVTTPREDRDTDVLVTEGAQLDPKAPLLWQHLHTFPIGKVVATLDHTKDVLRVLTALLDINELTSDAAKLIEAEVLRFSHGFRALDWEERKDKDGNPVYGFQVNSFEIMEVSLVSVPSNVDAEIELFAAGKLASPEFKAHAKHLHDLRTVQTPGIGPGEKGAPAGEPVEPPEEGGQLSGGPEGKAADPPEPDHNEKRGRVLSARNQDALTDTIEDLTELADGDLTRAQKALVNKAISRLRSVLKEAQEGDEESGDPTPKAAEFTVPSAMAFVLAEASSIELAQLGDTLRAFRDVEDGDAKASEYRQAVGV